ncbi:S24 family peptidase [Mucilaginibacter sp. 44-25]|uniref:LexA family protein n=1 Tax=Mucilaginibacter sp. 44-25 TaxID=1895794 RepID=UPI0009667274|nr:S24 family peptidase [Mucilaginibacter sp. 44-25]OJW15344.1 MAG: hypothetical protein BGO48_14570 [Mucilaginibacter sp. 44-25]
MHGFKPNFDPPQRAGHKQGRFVKVVNPLGCLEYADGAKIDLHKELTGNKHTVELMPIHTNIMRHSDLHHGGMIIVDKSLKPQRGNIVVVRYNDAIVIRRIEKSLTHWALVADDPREEKLLLGEFADYQLIGVVTHAINPCR